MEMKYYERKRMEKEKYLEVGLVIFWGETARLGLARLMVLTALLTTTRRENRLGASITGNRR